MPIESIESIAETMAAAVVVLNALLISLCQLLALFVISVGISKALFIFLKNSLFTAHTPTAFQQGRLEMGYAFSLGLSFLVGATILKTMNSSQWEDIGRLMVIIGIRTALNLLLERAINRSTSIELDSESDLIADQENREISQTSRVVS
ncbi:MAG: DUF1622 domain-containing protein [Thermosynechococcaceae cyanobacterium]